MRRHQPDYAMLAVVAGLLVFGLVMLTSATGPTAFQKFGDSYHYFKRQLFFGVLPGLVLLLLCLRLTVDRMKQVAPFMLPAAALLLCLGFIPGLRADYGSGSWINLFGASLQPSELAKLCLILYFAWWFARRDEEAIKGFWTGFLPFTISIAIVVALMMLQSDLGTTSVIVAFLFAMYIAAGASLKHLGALFAAGFAMFLVFIKIAPYRAARLEIFLRPDLDPQGVGYHINQARLAIGSGGWFGLGLGKSRQKFQYLPEVAGDSIFAIVSEELGFLVSAAVILAFLLFVRYGLKIAERSADPFARYAAVGITVWIGFQAALNISAMVGLMPLTGVPLPFVSHGGSAMLANLMAVGILASLSREARHQVPRK
ncbi:MAG: putative lipid II flippase FtsW [Patescibacteria group bacterium]|nr:MAG: putative lipid II flippase FtsW [Patescibacteria group bacterium]